MRSRKKMRGAGRLREFEASLREAVAVWPEEDRPGCGNWRNHLSPRNGLEAATRSCLTSLARR